MSRSHIPAAIGASHVCLQLGYQVGVSIKQAVGENHWMPLSSWPSVVLVVLGRGLGLSVLVVGLVRSCCRCGSRLRLML